MEKLVRILVRLWISAGVALTVLLVVFAIAVFDEARRERGVVVVFLLLLPVGSAGLTWLGTWWIPWLFGVKRERTTR